MLTSDSDCCCPHRVIFAKARSEVLIRLRASDRRFQKMDRLSRGVFLFFLIMEKDKDKKKGIPEIIKKKKQECMLLRVEVFHTADNDHD